MTVLW